MKYDCFVDAETYLVETEKYRTCRGNLEVAFIMISAPMYIR